MTDHAAPLQVQDKSMMACLQVVVFSPLKAKQSLVDCENVWQSRYKVKTNLRGGGRRCRISSSNGFHSWCALKSLLFYPFVWSSKHFKVSKVIFAPWLSSRVSLTKTPAVLEVTEVAKEDFLTVKSWGLDYLRGREGFWIQHRKALPKHSLPHPPPSSQVCVTVCTLIDSRLYSLDSSYERWRHCGGRCLGHTHKISHQSKLVAHSSGSYLSPQC